MKLPVTVDHTGQPDPARDPNERNERIREPANDRGNNRNGNRPRGDQKPREGFAKKSFGGKPGGGDRKPFNGKRRGFGGGRPARAA